MKLLTLLLLSSASTAFQIPRNIAELKGKIGEIFSGDKPASSPPADAPGEDGKQTYKAESLRFHEAKGICEMTPTVYQASGYAALTATEHMWFWFFAARENPDTAPLAIWVNGGPGSSSMVSLFDGNGPCHLSEDGSTVTHNDYAWNNKVNMIYIDQPIGVGFSYGNLLVGRTSEAAADIWKFLQIFFSHPNFAKYQSRELGVWSESYGGHFAPGFVAHFLEQNEKIAKGKLKGKLVNIKVLGIGNGLTDPLNQYEGYLKYAKSNPYRPLADKSLLTKAKRYFYQNGGCKAQILTCQATRIDTICATAQKYCNAYVWGPLAEKVEGNPFYVKDVASKHVLPNNVFLAQEEVKKQVGYEVPWSPVNSEVYDNFAKTGDWMKSSVPDLQKAINSDIRTLLYNGDADYVVNYFGIESSMSKLRTKNRKRIVGFRFVDYVIEGVKAGLHQSVENFHYVRVFGAGHGVPAYGYDKLAKGQLAERMFNQVMFGQPLSADETGVEASQNPEEIKAEIKDEKSSGKGDL